MYFFDVIDERGHRHHLPLWKFPQIVAQEIEHKKSEIEQLKRQMYAEESSKIAAAQSAQRQQIEEIRALDSPLDLTQDPGVA